MNYLQNLLYKTRQSIDMVQPRPLSRFELENQNPGSEVHEQENAILSQDSKETASPANNNIDHSKTTQSSEINFSDPLLSSTSEPILKGSLGYEQFEEQQIKGYENSMSKSLKTENPTSKQLINTTEGQGYQKRMSEPLNTKKQTAKQEINTPEGQGDFEVLQPKEKPNIQKFLQNKKHTTETVKTGLLNERMIDNYSRNNNKNSIEAKQKKMEEQNLPTVKISIGRVEVKAVKETMKPLQEKKKNHTPQMTLQDYINLKK